jgi:DNA polymerase I
LDISKIRLIAPYQVEGIQNATIMEAYKYLKTCKYVAVDTETSVHPLYKGIGSGLDPYTSMLISLQIGDEHIQYVIDMRYTSIGWISKILTSNRIIKLGVNLKFDYKMIKHHLDIELNNIYDIGLAELILTNGKGVSWSLGAIAKKYLNIDLYTNQLSLFESYVSKDTVKEYEKLEYDNLTLDLIKYSATDVVVPALAYPKILKEIKKDNLNKAVKLENQYTKVVALWELKGIKLDSTKWLNLLTENKSKLIKLENQLGEYLIAQNLEEFLGTNWNSSKQVAKIFKILDIPIQIVDKEKSIGMDIIYKDTVGKNHIKKYKNKFDILPIYLEYKTTFKAISTYGFKFLSNVNPISERVHTDIYQIVTTGRISSSKPNMQNIPSTKDFRACFVAEENKKLIICDYASQESRILADYANETNMIEYAISGGGDFHSLTATQMYGKVTPENRPIAKMLNFAIPYGTSAHKISNEIQIPLKKAQELIDTFFKGYPALEPYFKTVQELAFKNGYHLIDKVTKRRVYLKDYDKFKNIENFIQRSLLYHKYYKIPSKVWSMYYSMKGGYERDACNYLIQGTGGSMTKLASVIFNKQIEAKKWQERVSIINMVHDEINVECDAVISKTVAKLLSKSMQESGKVFIKKLPMPTSGQISDYLIK